MTQMLKFGRSCEVGGQFRDFMCGNIPTGVAILMSWNTRNLVAQCNVARYCSFTVPNMVTQLSFADAKYNKLSQII
jgi:hypothetical protein